jgi:hypothetical protein
MKKLFFLFFLLGIITFTSCSIGDSESDYSPQLSISSLYQNSVSVTSIDTLTVGDTLLMTAVATGVSNPLTSVKITNDTNYSTLSYPDVENLGSSVLYNGYTDLSDGYFYFQGLNIYSVTLQVKYIAEKVIKAGTTLTFVVSSTSQYSPMTYTLKIPIKAKTV